MPSHCARTLVVRTTFSAASFNPAKAQQCYCHLLYRRGVPVPVLQQGDQQYPLQLAERYSLLGFGNRCHVGYWPSHVDLAPVENVGKTIFALQSGAYMTGWVLQGVRQSASVGTGQGYTVGMALNPERQHELLVCAGDKPPGEPWHASACVHACVMLEAAQPPRACRPCCRTTCLGHTIHTLDCLCLSAH